MCLRSPLIHTFWIRHCDFVIVIVRQCVCFGYFKQYNASPWKNSLVTWPFSQLISRCRCSINAIQESRNSSVADKPRDAFVQMQWRIADLKHLLPICVTTPNVLGRFRDKGRFQSKITNFSHPMYLTPPLKGFPCNWIWALGSQKLERWGCRAQKEVWRYL